MRKHPFQIVVVAVLTLAAWSGHATDYTFAINNGRVIDPETGLNAVRHIGINDGTITALSENPIKATTTIDATGMVISPGFIDLHTHSPTPLGQHFQTFDGVTTSLELEAGAHPMQDYGSRIRAKALHNYGASAGYLSMRVLLKDGIQVIDQASSPAPVGIKGWLTAIKIYFSNSSEGLKRSFSEQVTAEEIADINALVEQSIDDGALGIGLALDYISEAVGDAELNALFRTAARKKVPLFIHIRRGINGDPSGLNEVINLAESTGASVHVCHITHNAIKNIDLFLSKIRAAQSRGVDISTEVLPFNAGSTSIGAAVFGRDWQTIFGITPDKVQRADTGEWFTAATFNSYREEHPQGGIIHHYLNEEWTRKAVAAPDVMIVSDLLAIQSLDKKVAPHHSAFIKILDKYVGQEHILDLPTAIKKMTLMPAQRLEKVAPAFKKKGRIQMGADADIIVLDLNKIKANASYMDPYQESEGVAHMFVNGVHLIKNGELIPNTYPGRQLLAK